MFRAKFMEGLKTAFETKVFEFPGRTASLEIPSEFRKMTRDLWSKGWVVYSKPPFSGPETVLEYMARYTHRVAISNYRIKACEGGKVTHFGLFANGAKKRILLCVLNCWEQNPKKPGLPDPSRRSCSI